MGLLYQPKPCTILSQDPTRRPTRRKDRRLEGLRERILGLADQRLSQDEAGLDAREAQSLPGLPPFLLSLLSGLVSWRADFFFSFLFLFFFFLSFIIVFARIGFVKERSRLIICGGWEE